jgi:hypothetical protein
MVELKVTVKGEVAQQHRSLTNYKRGKQHSPNL